MSASEGEGVDAVADRAGEGEEWERRFGRVHGFGHLVAEDRTELFGGLERLRRELCDFG